MQSLAQITQLIEQNDGLNDAVLATAFERLYPEIKALARSQLRKIRSGDTVTPTVLVNECYLKIRTSSGKNFHSSKHLICLIAKCMRQYLIDELRSKNRHKRNGEIVDVGISQIIGNADNNFRLLELNDALKQLQAIDPELSELTELKFFSGLNMDEISETLNTSKRHLSRRWNIAKTMLTSLLDEQSINN